MIKFLFIFNLYSFFLVDTIYTFSIAFCPNRCFSPKLRRSIHVSDTKFARLITRFEVRSTLMESNVQNFALYVQEALNRRSLQDPSSSYKKQYWIALAGAPGSGKSTFSQHLAQTLNARGITTSVIPMDGFHFYRRELDAMQNAAEAHAKRGSYWTFNATRLVQVFQCIGI